MKNKRNIFIVLFLLILGIISIFFISNNKNLYTCHNISWNDTPSDVGKKYNKLNMIDYETNKKCDNPTEINIDAYSTVVSYDNIKLSSPSLNFQDSEIDYIVGTEHDKDRNITYMTEIFDFNLEDYGDRDLMINEAENFLNEKINQLEKTQIELIKKEQPYYTWTEYIYKTNKNYIIITKNPMDSVAKIRIDYINPKYEEKDIYTMKYIDDGLSI